MIQQVMSELKLEVEEVCYPPSDPGKADIGTKQSFSNTPDSHMTTTTK